MSHRFPHLAQRLFNVPLAITPSKAELVMSVLADRFGIARVFGASGFEMAAPKIEIGKDYDGSPIYEEPYEIVAGVAVIAIEGTLVNKLGHVKPYSGMTGYDGLRQGFLAALDDEDVKAIVLDIDSPGGEVSGCFDLVDTIHAARGRKPVWAILTEHAYSAAYAIASAADRIVVPRTGGTGSVGVIFMHVDWSQALKDGGIAVTLITYGDRKADGNAAIPLSKEAFARYQSITDTMGDLFVDTVARNRGLTPDQVRATQAGLFLGAEGVAIGFADAVMAPDEAFADLVSTL